MLGTSTLRILSAGMLTIAASALPSAAFAADYLSDPEVKIARHDKRKTGTVFTNPYRSTAEGLSYFAFVFTPSQSEQARLARSGLIRYDPLPTCNSSQVELRKVFEHTPVSDLFDILFYSPDDQNQTKQVRSYRGLARPYDPALRRDPATGTSDGWQQFARFAGVRCLPTRFHFVEIGSQRYIAYREGDEAWKDPSSR